MLLDVCIAEMLRKSAAPGGDTALYHRRGRLQPPSWQAGRVHRLTPGAHTGW